MHMRRAVKTLVNGKYNNNDTRRYLRTLTYQPRRPEHSASIGSLPYLSSNLTCIFVVPTTHLPSFTHANEILWNTQAYKQT